MNTPASAAAGPTVGTNCRRYERTDAIDRLELGPMDAGGTGEGLYVGIRIQSTRTQTIYPGSGPS